MPFGRFRGLLEPFGRFRKAIMINGWKLIGDLFSMAFSGPTGFFLGLVAGIVLGLGYSVWQRRYD